jgi:hypothetical protein
LGYEVKRRYLNVAWNENMKAREDMSNLLASVAFLFVFAFGGNGV